MICRFLTFPPPPVFVYCSQANTTSVHDSYAMVVNGDFYDERSQVYRIAPLLLEGVL